MTITFVLAIMLMVHFDIHWAWFIALALAYLFDLGILGSQRKLIAKQVSADSALARATETARHGWTP